MNLFTLVLALSFVSLASFAAYLASSACDDPCPPLAAVEKLAAAWGGPPPDVTPKLPRSRPKQPWPYRPLSSAVAHSVGLTRETHALVALVTHARLPKVTTQQLVWFFSSGVRQTTTYAGDGQEWSVYLQWHPRDHIEQTELPHHSKAAAPPQDEQPSLAGSLWWICEFLLCSQAEGYTASSYQRAPQAQKDQERLIAALTEVKQLDRSGLVMSLPSSLGLGDTFWRLTHEWVRPAVLDDRGSKKSKLGWAMLCSACGQVDDPDGVLLNSSQVVGVVQHGWRPRWFARLRNAMVRGRFRHASGDPTDTMTHWVQHCVEEFGNLPHLLPGLYAAAMAAQPTTAGGSKAATPEAAKDEL